VGKPSPAFQTGKRGSGPLIRLGAFRRDLLFPWAQKGSKAHTRTGRNNGEPGGLPFGTGKICIGSPVSGITGNQEGNGDSQGCFTWDWRGPVPVLSGPRNAIDSRCLFAPHRSAGQVHLHPQLRNVLS